VFGDVDELGVEELLQDVLGLRHARGQQRGPPPKG
jgi:hypothetical protein